MHLVAIEDPNNKENSLICCGGFALRLIATLPMRRPKIRVVGTRVYCYENRYDPNGLLSQILPSNEIVVFDVWNPMSIIVPGENVRFGQAFEVTTSEDSSALLKPYQDPICVVA